ncbi:MAG: Flp pilus assembly complex ATPase component TadA [Bdellovibrionales bacterium]|nr:Flp pilus assembly complex ATPase component TadA [Bdellovibrionales bacterium]
MVGGKGGVGKSVVAANLCAALTVEMKAPTLLIDLDDRTCGDQNVITGLRPNKTVGEFSRFTGAVTAAALKSIVAQHPSGFSYLGATQGPEQRLSVDAGLFKKQLAAASANYRYIIVDLGNDISDAQMAIIEDSSCLLVVTSPEVLVVNQTKRLINDLTTATVPQELIQVVLNKVSRTGLNAQAISQTLRRPLIGALPLDDNTAMGALQRSTPFVLGQPTLPLSKAYHDLARRLTGGVLQKLKSLSRPANLSAASLGPASSHSDSPKLASAKGSGKSSSSDPLVHLKLSVHSELIKEMDLKKDITNSEGDDGKEQELRSKTTRVISQLVDRMGGGLPREERSRVIKEILDEALGLGPLEQLLEDKSVSEIMVNGAHQIYIEKDGKLQLSPVTFSGNLQLRNVIERIVTPLGRIINEKQPYVDARLKDGSRVNAVIEPLAIDGPSLTIRKFPSDSITIRDYTERFGSMTQEMADFLKICVEQGLNIIVSGGTGSGKTTLLNCLSSFIPANERIVTVEDAAELQLKQSHVVRLETRPANMEGTGEVSIRDLVRNSLRMRPDRIVVGECRDGAALDMLSAMNTGHDGSMTTVHANNAREAVARLETLCLMAGMDLPAKSIRDQIAGAVHLFVQIGRLSDGSRKIKSITEVAGIQGDVVTLTEIFRFKEEGFDKNRKIVGRFQATGMIPTFIEKFERRGVTIPRKMFSTNPDQGSKPSAGGGASSPTPMRKPTATPQATQVTRPTRIKRTGTGEK